MSAALVLAVVLLVVLAQVSSAAPGDISTLAGGGTGSPSGGGPATGVGLFAPRGVVSTPDGGFLIADTNHDLVEKVSASGILAVVVGDGATTCSGDGGAATASSVYIPQGVAPTSDGGFLVADTGNNRIRRVSAAGIITTVAGDGGCTSGSTGDGGPATAAKLAGPTGVASIPGGGFLIADSNNQRIREVSAGGTISTVAGNGTPGYSGDGGAATAAQLQYPQTVAVTASGGFLIADSGNHVVREASAGGTISTVAGNGTAGSSGDGSPATAAQLQSPFGVAATAAGGFLIADGGSRVIRQVSAGGTISTVAGNGTAFSSGDGGPATAAAVGVPFAVSSTADGGFLIADDQNSRIRKVEGTLPPPPPPPPDTTAPAVSHYGLTNNPFVVAASSTPTFGSSAAKHKKGTKLRYTLSEAATVKIVISQRSSGRRKGKRCVAPTRQLRKAKKCTRILVRGTLRRTSHAGANSVAFSGRIRSKALKPGHYQATLTATDTAKNTSKPKTIPFTIVKR